MRADLVTIFAVTVAMMSTGCGLEGALFGPVTDQGHTILPEPRDTIFVAQASGLGGATATLYTSGATVPDGGEALVEAGNGVEGRISFALPGTLSAAGAVLWVESPVGMAAGIIPEIPAAASVFHESRVVRAWEQHASLADLDGYTTAAAFILLKAADELGLALDALTPGSIRAALDSIDADQVSGAGDVALTTDLVSAIIGCSGEVGDLGLRPFGDAAISLGVHLNSEWLTSAQAKAAALDKSPWCDSLEGLTADDFGVVLANAASGLELGVCYEEARIPVVFHVDLSASAVDGNCSAATPYKHTAYTTQKRVFFTGGVHGDTPVCNVNRMSACLTEDEIDATNALLGDWVPNMVPMFDDGTNGDAKANDGIWTLVLHLPFWDIASASDGAGVRLGYKYTFGQAGTGWTDSEEWPGNRRLLELVDVNSDRRIVRYDVFGDEASNKDFVNQLSPANGGCGVVTWEGTGTAGCAGDTRENQVDLDGDCNPDAFDAPGPVTPLLIDC